MVEDRLTNKETNTIVSKNYKTSEIVVSPVLFNILINQYKNPIGSIVREITSNAIDATKEAKSNKPVIVTLSNTQFTVEDFGIGISPKRVHNYFDFNKSTKRYSNNQIGMFGLGAKCVLSYRKDVTIITRYNGIEYEYFQFIDDIGMPSYILLSEKETDKENGTKVIIDLNKTQDVPLFIKEMKNLIYTEIIYINDLTNISSDKINKTKIYKYKTFVIKENDKNEYKSYYRKYYPFILYNGIVYPLDEEKLNYNNMNIIKNMDIGIIINNDELSLVPSRDSFLYDERTIKLLNHKIKNVIEELNEIIKKQTDNLTFDTLPELFELLEKDNNLITLGNKTFNFYPNNKFGNITIYNKILPNFNFSNIRSVYKGKPIYYSLKPIEYSSTYSTMSAYYNYDYKKLKKAIDNNSIIKTESAKIKRSINEIISTKLQNVYYIKPNNDNRINSFNTYIKKNLSTQLNDIEIKKLLLFIKKLEDDFYKSIKIEYNDFYKFLSKDVQQQILHKKRIFGNIYVLDREHIKRQFPISTYKFDENKYYILASNNEDYLKLQTFSKLFDNTYLKFAILSKMFLKKLLNNNIKFNYIYMKDLPEYLSKENIKDELYNYISKCITFDSIENNKKRYANIIELSKYYKFVDTFTTNKKYIRILKEFQKHKSYGATLYDYFKNNLNIPVNTLINYETKNLIYDFIEYIEGFDNMNFEKRLKLYNNTLTSEIKYKNLVSLNTQKIKI